MTDQVWWLLIALVAAALYCAVKLNEVAARVDDINHRLKHLHPIGKDERDECEEETKVLNEGDRVARSGVRRKIWKTKTRWPG